MPYRGEYTPRLRQRLAELERQKDLIEAELRARDARKPHWLVAWWRRWWLGRCPICRAKLEHTDTFEPERGYPSDYKRWFCPVDKTHYFQEICYAASPW
jgi:hypothetical protein